jgi:hypothetical protein
VTFILLYGSDGAGKSIQAKSIAELKDNPEHWSFAVKNRKLYKDSGITSIELLKINDDMSINPYQTMDNFTAKVNACIKSGMNDCIIIDEISQLRTWAQPCALEWFNRSYGTKNTKIGENNALAWEYVNKLTYGQLERLSVWAELNDALVIAITALDDVRVERSGDDGKPHSVKTGQTVALAKPNVMKLADIKVRLERDGKNGKGYYAIFDKEQGWMKDGKDAVRVEKNGLYTELVARGVI